MTTRTTNARITFFRPFKLNGMDGRHPAGSYVVETDEDLLEGLSTPVYRRTATYIVLPGPPGSAIASETFNIAPEELRAALSRDLEAAVTGSAEAKNRELTLTELLTDDVIQTTVSSTPLALGEFRELMRNLIAKQPDGLGSIARCI